MKPPTIRFCENQHLSIFFMHTDRQAEKRKERWTDMFYNWRSVRVDAFTCHIFSVGVRLKAVRIIEGRLFFFT